MLLASASCSLCACSLTLLTTHPHTPVHCSPAREVFLLQLPSVLPQTCCNACLPDQWGSRHPDSAVLCRVSGIDTSTGEQQRRSTEQQRTQIARRGSCQVQRAALRVPIPSFLSPLPKDVPVLLPALCRFASEVVITGGAFAYATMLYGKVRRTGR